MSKAADAFDPDRDPFNPEREGWLGWGWDMYGVIQAWKAGDYAVIIHHGEDDRVIIDANGDNEMDPIYDAAFIPHRTVVSILVSNGYEPEVGV